jgi:hypothetical protein
VKERGKRVQQTARCSSGHGSQIPGSRRDLDDTVGMSEDKEDKGYGALGQTTCLCFAHVFSRTLREYECECERDCDCARYGVMLARRRNRRHAGQDSREWKRGTQWMW